MRKSDTLQLVIIILAIILGFSSLQYFISAVFNVALILIDEHTDKRYVAAVFPSLLTSILQAFGGWVLLTKSKDLAIYIYERTGIGRSFKIISNPADILFLLLIVLGFYMLLLQLPVLLLTILDTFKSKVSPLYSPLDPRSTDWTANIIRLMLPLLLLMFTKPVANYFAGKMTFDEIIISEDGEDQADLLDINEV